jgi:hypothetical protein
VISVPTEKLTAAEKIILTLAEYEYLTALQVTNVLYAPSSLTYVREKLKSLVDAKYVLALAGRSVNMPRVYTLGGKGRKYAALLGRPAVKRFRPSEQREAGENFYYMKHTLAVSDVLIAARLLSQSAAGITLNRMYRERELRRRIYVTIQQRGEGRARKICLEPDASLDFVIHEDWHQQAWRDFFHIEVYRHLPMETRFKQKVHGYAVMAETGKQEELFQTSALSVAVFAATDSLAKILKRWTEEALTAQSRHTEGDRFFFTSLNTTTTSPKTMFLSPLWQQAFGTATTPLLIIEEGHAR